MHPTKESLIDLIRDARKGEVVLPEFQRSFIWERRAVEELLVSILNDYFIGSLLILAILPDDHPFRARKIEGVEDPTIYAKKMVLDGQQRLTSVHYALYGPDVALKNTSYPYRFLLDIEAALEDRWEEAVFSRPTYYQQTEILFGDTRQGYEQDTLSFAALQGWESWTRWYDGYRDFHRERGTFDEERTEALAELARRFLNYQVALIELPQKTPLETVVEVFERINRTGSPLTVFELLTARLWKHDINLRELWEDAREQHAWLNEMASEKGERYPKFALQLVALLRGKECKRKDLILIEGDGFGEDWETATYYLNRALERLHSTSEGGYGVVPSVGLPYSTIATPLAAILYHVENNEKGNPDAYRKLHHWYWSSVFTERYGGPIETLSQRDYAQVSRWITDGDSVPEAVLIDEQELQRDLRDVVRAGAIYKGIMCLIALRGARDFFTGDTIELNELDDHHVFPQDFLKTKGHDQVARNTILNRTLVTRDTNRRLIRAKRPSAYLAEMERLHGTQQVREILDTHFINAAAIEAMRADDYESFLRARDGALREEIRRRCVYSTIGLAKDQPSPHGVEPGEESPRLDRVEAAIRDVIDEALTEAFGPEYWKRIVPPDIRTSVEARLDQAARKNPELAESRPSTRRLLDFCDFSDYERLIFQKNVWPEVESIFQKRGEAERHLVAARQYRNAVKHGRMADTVERLSGEAAILWLERVLGVKEFSDDIHDEDEPTVEDCARVLVRRPVPAGQRGLYSALLKAGQKGLTTDELVSTIGRRDGADLAGLLGALGRRINETPGYGAAKRPGIDMVLEVRPATKGGNRYTLRPIMIDALRKVRSTWFEGAE